MDQTATKKQPFILLVDDMPKNLQVLGHILQEEGYHFTPATSGKQALKIIEKRHPDVILLDIMMPEMDGFEVCATLKRSPETRDIPVIFLTAKTDTDDVVRGFDLGAVDYVTKPFRKEELLARVRTHLALQCAKRELEESNATKDKFFSIIAHDLRGPFNGFLALTEMMIERISHYPTEKIVETLDKYHSSAKNLYALLENLLTWSRIQRNLIDYAPRTFCLTQLVEAVIELFQTNAEQKQITLTGAIPPETSVCADYHMTEAILRNLLSNALKFTKSGGTVTISEREEASFLEIAVTDNGIGMTQQTVNKLFRIDVKHSSLGTADERGTGLGLILCKEFVEKHGGAIWVESEPDRGTTFRFTLPRELKS